MLQRIMIRLEPEAADRIHKLADAAHRDFRRQIEHIIHQSVAIEPTSEDLSTPADVDPVLNAPSRVGA